MKKNRNSSNCLINKKNRGFSLAEMLLSLLIVSVCLAATMPVITQKKFTGGSSGNYWMSSNNSDIYYGIGNSRVSIGSSVTPTTNAKLTIASSSTVSKPLIYFMDVASTDEIGRISFDTNDNTGIGNSVFGNNTSGNSDTAVGAEALALNTTGNGNTAIGNWALYANTTGSNNTAGGAGALYANTTGANNTAFGLNALTSNTIGYQNTAVGQSALQANTEGYYNTAVGLNSLFKNTTGVNNTALGFSTMFNNTTGNNNTAVGYWALESNTIGVQNTALGLQALNYNTTGNYNTAIGEAALQTNTTGGYNSALGSGALYSSTTGTYNTALGLWSLYNNTTGSYNIAIGNYAGPAADNGSYKLYIDEAQNGTSSFIYGDMTAGSKKLTVNANLGLTVANGASTSTITPGSGTITTSDIRLKNIKGVFNEGLDKIIQIQPKNYTFKNDTKKVLHTGVIAQDLRKIFPNSVYKQQNGYLAISQDEIFYGMINSIKELNSKNEKLSAENKELKSELKNINERLDKIENGTSSTKHNKKLGLLQKIWIFFFG